MSIQKTLELFSAVVKRNLSNPNYNLFTLSWKQFDKVTVLFFNEYSIINNLRDKYTKCFANYKARENESRG